MNKAVQTCRLLETDMQQAASRLPHYPCPPRQTSAAEARQSNALPVGMVQNLQHQHIQRLKQLSALLQLGYLLIQKADEQRSTAVAQLQAADSTL